MFVEIVENQNSFFAWKYKVSIKEDEQHISDILTCYVGDKYIDIQVEPFQIRSVGLSESELEGSFEDFANFQSKIKTAHQLAIRFSKAIKQNEDLLIEEIKSKSKASSDGFFGIDFKQLQSILMRYVLGESFVW